MLWREPLLPLQVPLHQVKMVSQILSNHNFLHHNVFIIQCVHHVISTGYQILKLVLSIC